MTEYEKWLRRLDDNELAAETAEVCQRSYPQWEPSEVLRGEALALRASCREEWHMRGRLHEWLTVYARVQVQLVERRRKARA